MTVGISTKQKICDVCGKPIENPYGTTKMCKACVARIRESLKPENIKTGVCAVCGKKFEPSKYYHKEKIYCSYECRIIGQRVKVMDRNAAHPLTAEQKECKRMARKLIHSCVQNNDNHYLDMMARKADESHMSYGKYVAWERMKANG